MKHRIGNITVLVAAVGLLFGGMGSALAATHAARHAAASTAKLTVKITDTGTVWGTVNISYKRAGKSVHKSCNAATCHLSLPKGVKATLSQKPTDSATWPFSKWTIQVGSSSSTSTAKSVSVKLAKPMTVSAVYVVAGSSSSSAGSNPGYNYP